MDIKNNEPQDASGNPVDVIKYHYTLGVLQQGAYAHIEKISDLPASMKISE